MIPRSQEEAPEVSGGSSLRAWLFGVLLVVATVVTYLPCLDGGIVWDDDAWTVHLRPLFESRSALWQIWTNPTALQQYYPVTGTTFWLDHHLWGDWTLPYHIQNVLLHAVAALLFWKVLRLLDVPGAWLAAALFALHPMMVESVAWLAERKNVLSLAFFLGAVVSYLHYVSVWKAWVPTRSQWWYAAALVLFLVALLAKVTAYVFPPTILLLCWWKCGRIRRSEIVRLAPFFVFSIGVGWFVGWVEKHHVGAEGADWEATFAERLLLAGRAIWFYPGKLLWPADLRFMYPRWRPDAGAPEEWILPLLVVGAAIALWHFRARIGRGVFIAVFFFLGTIFPVLGFLNVYGMRFASVADHWVYMSSLAVFALVAGGVARLADRLQSPRVLPTFAAVVLPVLALLSWRAAGQYRDVETLWLSTSAKDPEHWMPQYHLGLHYMQQGRVEEALARYQQSVKRNPTHAIAYSNIGVALLNLGRDAEAISAFRKALDLGAKITEVRYNLALALLRRGHLDEGIVALRQAIAADPERAVYHFTLAGAWLRQNLPDEAAASFREAIRIDPAYGAAHVSLGNLLFKSGRAEEALEHYRRAVEINPGEAVAKANVGAVLLQLGRLEEAAEAFRSAIGINPGLADVHANLGLALLRLARYGEAADAFAAALRVNPSHPAALMNAALLMSANPDKSERNAPRALEFALRAEQFAKGRDLQTLRTLAAAHAENGQFPNAEQTIQRALSLIREANNAELNSVLQRELELYRAGQPLRLPVRP